MNRVRVSILFVFLFVAMLAVPAGTEQLPAVPDADTFDLFPGDDEGQVRFDITATPSMLPADGKTEAEIVVILTDPDGAPLSNRRIEFYLEEGYGRLTATFPVTDSDGIAEAVYVAGRVATAGVIRVTDEETGETAVFTIPTSISASISIELVEPSRFISTFIKRQTATRLYTLEVDVFPDRLVADGFSTSRITARLYNLDGSYAVGVPLKVRLLSGGGEIIRERTTTDAQGSLETFYRAGEVAGTAVIEVLEPVSGLREIVEIPVLESGPAKIEIFFRDSEGNYYEEEASLPADGLSTITVVARVLNLADLPVPGVEVEFSLAEDYGIIEVLYSTSDAEGKVYAIFRAGTQTGVETITAFLTSNPSPDGVSDVSWDSF